MIMAEHVIKLPDVGEGIAEAELVEWHVKVGDVIREDAVLAAVMTDKATVEIPSPVEGIITWLGAEVGDAVPIGSPIVKIDVAGGADVSRERDTTEKVDATAAASPKAAATQPDQQPDQRKPPAASPSSLPRSSTLPGPPRQTGDRPVASPAVRLRAKEGGIDLRQVPGSGPAGRITQQDLEVFVRGGTAASTSGLARREGVEQIKVVGLRRRIAEKMTIAKSRIPHITYIEEIDVTALEDLRAKLNGEKKPDRPKLTLLPFLMRAMVRAIAEQPALNATFDDEAGVIHRHAAVHIGIAAQTPSGLVVPVVRHAEARNLFDCAAEAARLADAARNGTATREELSGSTITITSLGAMGGVATTPVINHPEVAIVGVNKIMVRPVWDGTQFMPRKMMNLSSSFDHRVIDGWDAAVFVQRIKGLLETPALMFVEG